MVQRTIVHTQETGVGLALVWWWSSRIWDIKEAINQNRTRWNNVVDSRTNAVLVRYECLRLRVDLGKKHSSDWFSQVWILCKMLSNRNTQMFDEHCTAYLLIGQLVLRMVQWTCIPAIWDQLKIAEERTRHRRKRHRPLILLMYLKWRRRRFTLRPG